MLAMNESVNKSNSSRFLNTPGKNSDSLENPRGLRGKFPFFNKTVKTFSKFMIYHKATPA